MKVISITIDSMFPLKMLVNNKSKDTHHKSVTAHFRGGRGRQRGLKSTIHDSLAVKSTIHMLSYTKSKSTHTKFKNEEGKPKNTIFKLNTFQCCHRIIVTMYFLSDFTQINAWSHLQHFLVSSVHYVLHSKRSQAWPGLTDHILH